MFRNGQKQVVWRGHSCPRNLPRKRNEAPVNSQTILCKQLLSFSVTPCLRVIAASSRAGVPAPQNLPLQQIHWRGHIMHPEILRQRWILPRHRLIHRIRDIAIRNMPRRRRTQLGDVNCLGKIHLEERPLFERQRDRVLRILFRLGSLTRRQIFHRRLHSPHHRLKLQTHARIFHIKQHFISMLRGRRLHHLNAAPVPVHVAEAARIHQNVEAELLPRAEAPQHLVILPTMPQPDVDDRPPPAPPAGSAGTNDGNARTAAWSQSPLPAALHPTDRRSPSTAPAVRAPSTPAPPAATPVASPSHTHSDRHTSPASAPPSPRAATRVRPALPTPDSPPESQPPDFPATPHSRCKPRPWPLFSATRPAFAPLYEYAKADARPASPKSSHSQSHPERCWWPKVRDIA